MGAMKEQAIDLMNAGVSNVYTVFVCVGGGTVLRVQKGTLKEAKAFGREARKSFLECSVSIEAHHLRTGRNRFINF
jgi:hypothetical protein